MTQLVSLQSCRKYFDLAKPQYLSWEFYEPYLTQEPPFGQLGAVVFLRTYSRFVPELGRREKFAETCLRVVEYSLSLDTVSSKGAKRVEAQMLFDCLFNLRGFASGRAYWIAGTPQTEKCGSAAWNCFGRETEFLTRNGYKTFADFQDGDTVEVLSQHSTGASGWKVATVHNYGQAKLYKLTLVRGKAKKVFYTTADHRWLVKTSPRYWARQEKTTLELSKKDRFPIIRSGVVFNRPEPCRVAIQHGIVFGDGHRESDRTCRIDLQNESQSLAGLFTTGQILNQGKLGGKINPHETIVASLPYYWKDLPDLNRVNSAYLTGFLMGWFAADGSTKSNVSLSNKDKEVLEWARSAFAMIGIYTSEIIEQRSTSPFDGSDKPLFRINIHKECVDESFFVLESDLLGYEEVSREQPYWTFLSLEETDRFEDVWCVSEPETETFVLSNGIITRNCCFRAIDDVSSFSEVFYWLLLGAGVGFSVERKYINQLPVFSVEKRLEHEPYSFNGSRYPKTRIEGAGTPLFDGIVLDTESLTISDGDFLKDTALLHERHVKIYIGDSKEGWCNAVRSLIHLMTLPNIVSITFNYNNVRPKGDRIKTFGGRASGHQNIQDILQRTYEIICESGGRLSSVNVLDIVNSIGLGVVSGGVRRTAEIGLGDVDDTYFIEAKENLWTDESKAKHRATRVMSNNSVLAYERPSLEKIKQIIEKIKTNGEPGFWIIGNAQKHDPNIKGTNPCAETALDSHQSCNLTTQNLLAHVENGKLDWYTLEETLRLITRIGCRQTTATQWHPKWNKVQKRDRLLGVSMTGVEDAFDVLNWTTVQKNTFYNWAADIVRDEADRYNALLGIQRSTRVTLVKPEGTLSQLPTVSSGIGKAYAPYYLRRVRFSRLDPLAIALYELGIPAVPENNQGENLFAEQCNTWVFTFPIKTNAKIRAIDEPLESQFERYLRIQTSYVRNGYNASNTMTVAPDEWDKAAELVYKHWDDIIGITFLPRFDPREGANAAYPNMPYEPCEKHEYEQLASILPQLTESELIELIAKHEQAEEEQSLDDACATGSCPIR